MGIEEISESISGLSILENKYKHANYISKHEFPELTAICPITRLPDFYEMRLDYVPDEYLVELKSFKLFLNAFRDREILHEEITNEILEKFTSIVKPRNIKIEMKVRVRGGMETTIIRSWSKSNGDEIHSPSENV